MICDRLRGLRGLLFNEVSIMLASWHSAPTAAVCYLFMPFRAAYCAAGTAWKHTLCWSERVTLRFWPWRSRLTTKLREGSTCKKIKSLKCEEASWRVEIKRSKFHFFMINRTPNQPIEPVGPVSDQLPTRPDNMIIWSANTFSWFIRLNLQVPDWQVFNTVHLQIIPLRFGNDSVWVWVHVRLWA